MSNSTGWDNTSMKIIKQVSQLFARICCHLSNRIIDTGRYPSNLKTAKVIPIRKPQKCPTSEDSHRPICILPTVDKVIESLLKDQLEKYFEGNQLIPNQHHGGRKNHSTVTAMAAIDLNHKTLKEQKNTVGVMATDLSAAYDLVDHNLLIKKLQHYGI